MCIRDSYTKSEYEIPMRDGAKLFTAVYVPKDASSTYPILLNRTPYSVAPYGVSNFKDSLGPSPRVSVYLVAVAILLTCAGLIVASPETSPRAPGALRSLRPQVALPRNVRRMLPVGIAVFLSTWAVGAFYQAFVPSLAADQLHTTRATVVGLMFAAYMAPSVLGAPIGGRLRVATGQRLGMVIFLVGLTGIIGALAMASPAGFIAFSVLAGIGQGIGVSASIRGLLHGTTTADRAPIFATVYLLCYLGAALASGVSGQLTHTFTLLQLAIGYGLVAVIATALTLVAARDPR